MNEISQSKSVRQFFVLCGYMVKLSSDHSRIAALTCIFIVKQEVERHKVCIKPFYGMTVAPHNSDLVFQMLANYSSDVIIEWHYNEVHHGRSPMDGIVGTIKDLVFRQVKSGKVIKNSAKEFYDPANRLVPSISTILQMEKDLLFDPDDIEQSLSVPSTLNLVN